MARDEVEALITAVAAEVTTRAVVATIVARRSPDTTNTLGSPIHPPVLLPTEALILPLEAIPRPNPSGLPNTAMLLLPMAMPPSP